MARPKPRLAEIWMYQSPPFGVGAKTKIRKIYSLTLSSNGEDNNLSRQEPPSKRRRLDNGHSVSSTSNFKEVLFKKISWTNSLEKLSENEVIRKLFAENEANGTQETDLLSAEWTLQSRERLLDAAENLVTPSPASTSQINENENGMVCEGPYKASRALSSFNYIWRFTTTFKSTVIKP